MNPLTLKTLAYNTDISAWCSPSKKDFLWKPGINKSECDLDIRLSMAYIPNILDHQTHHCGIYSSPNPKTLREYATYETSIVVLLNNYGFLDIWTAPIDLNGYYICRSWAARIVAVAWFHPIDENKPGYEQDGAKWAAACHAMDTFGINALPWKEIKEMIKVTWNITGLDPFDKEYVKVFNKE
jgi:hypothetical protein